MDLETLQTLINIRNYSDLLEKYPDYISLNVDNIGGYNEQKNR